jgi:hypothetical protein
MPLNAAQLLKRAHARRARCEAIAVKARATGLDVTWEQVNRHYPNFCRWDEGRLATGYLIRRTGLHWISDRT